MDELKVKVLKVKQVRTVYSCIINKITNKLSFGDYISLMEAGKKGN